MKLAGVTFTVVLLGTTVACTPSSPAPSPAPSSSAPASPSPSASPSAPASSVKPAAPTDRVEVNDRDSVETFAAGDACDYPVTLNLKSQETTYKNGNQFILLFADEAVTVVNPANQKVFNATGDGAVVVDLAKDGTTGRSVATGAALHAGSFTLPGETKRRTGVVFTTSKVMYTQHNIGQNDYWIEVERLFGPYTDVCAKLR